MYLEHELCAHTIWRTFWALSPLVPMTSLRGRLSFLCLFACFKAKVSDSFIYFYELSVSRFWATECKQFEFASWVRSGPEPQALLCPCLDTNSLPVPINHCTASPLLCAHANLRAGSISPLHFLSKSRPYNKFTSEQIYLFPKGQPHKLSKKCKLKQVPFLAYKIGKDGSNYIFSHWQRCGRNGHCRLSLVRGPINIYMQCIKIIIYSLNQ